MFGNHFLNFTKVIKYQSIVDNRDNYTVNIEILFSTLSHTPSSYTYTTLVSSLLQYAILHYAIRSG